MPRLNPKQNEYIRDAHARWCLKVGAVRSGKSYCDIAFVILSRLRAVKDKAGLNVIIGVSKETVERNVLQPMREIYTSDVVGTINSRNIAMVAGVPVYCLGAEKASQVSKIQGMSIKYCYGDEIAKWSPNVFDMLKSRLDKPYSRFDGSCNPESPEHWLKQFIDSDGLDIYVQKYTIFDNPALSKEFVDNLCKEYEGTVYYNRLILGEWTLAQGLIYPMYEKAFEEPPESKAEAYALSIDYGTMNAFAVTLWGKYGPVWWGIDEYYYSGRDAGATKTDDEYYQDIEKFLDERGIESKLYTVIDPSAASFIALLRKNTKRYNVKKANNDVLKGIELTAVAMQRGIIKFSSKCKNTKKEFGGYVWDESAIEDRPVKVNDHCLTGETLVMTDSGEKPISELVGTVGNVLSYNTTTNQPEIKPYKDCRLTQKKAKIYKIELEDDRYIRCTGEHPVLTERGYKRADELTVNDRIIEVCYDDILHE